MSRKRYSPEEIIDYLRESRDYVVYGQYGSSDLSENRDTGTERITDSPRNMVV